MRLTSPNEFLKRDCYLAAIIISIISIELVYLFMQKYFVKGMMLGAVKE